MDLETENTCVTMVDLMKKKMLYLQMCGFLLGPVNIVVGGSTYLRFWLPPHKAPL